MIVPNNTVEEIDLIIQVLHKSMVQVQKLITNVLLTLHGFNIHRQPATSLQASACLICFLGQYGVIVSKLFVCSVLRRRNLLLQCSMSFVHGSINQPFKTNKNRWSEVGWLCNGNRLRAPAENVSP